MKKIYNPVPKFSYGINIGLTYKNFDLSMFWQGVCDNPKKWLPPLMPCLVTAGTPIRSTCGRMAT